MPTLYFLTGTLAAAAIAAAASNAVASDCYADWGKAGEIVRREKLLTVEQLAATSQQDLAGSIVKSTLCKDGDDWIYQLVVKGGNGALKSAVVSAKSR
ncbi:MAG: hypothetical protein ACKVP4_04585 [Hyphomicrobium sp.]